MYFFFSSSVITEVNTFVFIGSVSAQRITYEYSIDDVTATWIVVNLVSPPSARALHNLTVIASSSHAQIKTLMVS